MSRAVHVHIERDKDKALALLDAAVNDRVIRMETELFSGPALICSFTPTDDYWVVEFYADGPNESPNADPNEEPMLELPWPIKKAKLDDVQG